MSSSIPFDRIAVAPMLNITNDYQRYMVRLMSKRTTLYTEMFVDEMLVHSKFRSNLVWFDKIEHPIIAQLGGSNKYKMLEAAKLLESEGYDGININCGCPSPKVAEGCFGARLMLSPWRVYDIVQHLQRHLSIPVTVKCRIGVDQYDSYEELCRFIRIVSGAGTEQDKISFVSASDDDMDNDPLLPPIKPNSCSTQKQETLSSYGAKHFIIHARKCLLSGLSVKQNRSVPPLHYDWVFRLLDDFPSIDFSINGGVLSLGQAKDLLEKRSQNGRQLRGVMIGRLLTKAPWNFHYIDQFFYGESNPNLSPFETIMKYVDYCEEMEKKGYTQYFSTNELLKPLFNIFVNIPGSLRCRREMFEAVCKDHKTLREAVMLGLSFIDNNTLHDRSPGDPDRLDEYCAPK